MLTYIRTVVALLLVLPWVHANAQYPTKPIRLVVPFTAGDVLDNSARLIAAQLGPSLGQQVIVENRVGAAGSIAAEAVAKSSPDGYTLLFGTAAMMGITPYLRKTPYDPERDFEPLARVTAVALVVVVNNDFPAKNWNEFLDVTRRNPGKFTYASSGEGTILHLFGEQIQAATGIKLTHIPYKGMAAALTDLLSGQINVYTESSVVSHVQAGRARALAVFSENRLAEIPNVPTLKELGVRIDGLPWFGIFAPKGTPPDLLSRLSSEIARVTASNDFKTNLPQGAFPAFLASDPFRKSIDEERQTYRGIIKRLNLRLD